MKRNLGPSFIFTAIVALLLAFPCVSLASISGDTVVSGKVAAATGSDPQSTGNSLIQQAGYYGPLTVYAPSVTVPYDGQPHGITAEVSDPKYTVSYMDENGTYTLTESPTFTELGTYTVNFKAASDTNEAYGTATVTITRASLKVIAISQTKRYGSTMDASDLTYLVCGVAPGEKPAITGSLACLGLDADAIVGTYRISRGTLEIKGSSTLDLANYNVTFISSRMRVRNGAGLSISVEDGGGVYDGSAFGLGAITVTADGQTVNDATIEYSVDGGAWTTDKPTLTDVGTMDVRVRASLDQYVTTDPVAASITVTPATLTVTADDTSTVFGTAISADKLTYQVTGAASGQTPVFEGALSCTGATASKLGDFPIEQGTLALAASDGTDSSGFNASDYDLVFKSGKLSVVKNTTLVVSVDDVTATYDGLPHSLGTVTTMINGKTTKRATVEYSDDGGKTWSATSPSVTDVTTSAITVLVRASLAGYETTTPVKATLEVTPATLKVTATDLSTTFGTPIDADKLTYTVTGTIDGQTPVFTGALACDGISATALGDFDITQGTLALADGKTSGSAAASGTAASSAAASGTAASSASANSAAASSTSSGSAGSSSSSSADEGIVGSGFTSEGGMVDATFKASNYTLDFTPGTLTVSQNTTLTIKADSTTAVYDGEEHSLQNITVTADGAETRKATIEYSTDGGTTWTADTPAITEVSDSTEVEVRASLKGYATTQPVTVSLTITPATIKVTADDATTMFATPLDPAGLTYTATGAIEGQTPVFTGTLSCTGAEATALGDFDITQGTLALADSDSTSSGTGDTGFSAADYTISFVAGKLTVTQNTTLEITVKDVKATYDGNAHPLETAVTANGTKTDEATIEYSADKGKTWSSSPSLTDVADSGSYLVRASLDGYATTDSEQAKLTIEPATVKVTADDASTMLGTALDADALTYTAKAPVSWEIPAFSGTLSCDGADSTQTGDFDIVQGTLALADNSSSGFLAANYELAFTPGKLTVTQNTTLAISVGSVTTTYDGKLHTLDTVNVFADGEPTDKATVEYSSDGGKTWSSEVPSATDVSQSVEVLVRASLDGYQTTDSSTASLTIQKEPATIEAIDAKKNAGDIDPGLTVKITGAVGDEELAYTVSRESGEEVGTYPIDITLDQSSVNDNYDITTIPGTFTIAAAPVASSAASSASSASSQAGSASSMQSSSASAASSASGVSGTAASGVSGTVATSGSGSANNSGGSQGGANLSWLWLLLILPAAGVIAGVVGGRSKKPKE